MNRFNLFLLYLGFTAYGYGQSPTIIQVEKHGDNVCYQGEWKLVFSDEFDQTNGLDTNKWITWFPDLCGEEKPDAWGIQNRFARTFEIKDGDNGGQQVYRKENVVVKDGKCYIIGKRENATWAGVTKPWSAGMIRTRRFDFQLPQGAPEGSVNEFDRGKWEIRCKIPKGKGFWCSFWGSGDDEIDVFEAKQRINNVLRNKKKSKSFFNLWPEKITSYLQFQIHGINDDPATKKNEHEATKAFDWEMDFSSDFHTYTIEWDKATVIWYIDGVKVYSVYGYKSKDNELIKNCTPKKGIYHKQGYFPAAPQCLIASFCIGDHGGFGIADKNSPDYGEYVIDYIRVWQKEIQPGRFDICDFKLEKMDTIQCNNRSISLNIRSSKNLFKKWDAYGARIETKNDSSITVNPITPHYNGLMSISATNANEVCDFNVLKNTRYIWFGPPKHDIHISLDKNKMPICWRFSCDTSLSMRYGRMGNRITTTFGQDGLGQSFGCQTTIPFRIPYSFISTNICGEFKREGVINDEL